MSDFTQEYMISAPATKVWQALTDPAIIEKWGAGPNVLMNLKVGGKFSLWDGDIYGTNKVIEKNELLEQEWYGGDWKKPSKVIFKLTEDEDGTKLILEHKNVPVETSQDFQDGWRDYYIGPLRKYVEEEDLASKAK